MGSGKMQILPKSKVLYVRAGRNSLTLLGIDLQFLPDN